jgi:acetyltransferase-like isoleucine patch superfamily enzyme
MADKAFIHPQALVETVQIGQGTKIWAFAHVQQNVVIGDHCNIGDHVFVEQGVVIGNGVTIKNGVSIWAGVSIDDYAFIGPNAVFTNDRYPRSPRHPALNEKYTDDCWLEETHIAEGVTIGANATILCGTTLAPYAMVAACSFVNRNLRRFELVAGIPATFLSYVCMCGHPLSNITRPRCAVCGRCYIRQDEELCYIEETESP